MKLLAITACPTGVAHTYMAAEALDIAAKEMGHEIKVETHGAIGIENFITEEDLKEAKAIIIAADTHVDKSKFNNIVLIEVPVKEAIKDPKALINQAIDRVNSEQNKADEKSSEKGKTEIYKHLMTGISFTLPFFMVYGIFLSLSMYMERINFVPIRELSSLFSMISKDGAFTLMIPILSGYIAYSISDKPALMPGMIGGLLSSRLGMGFFGGIFAGFLAGYAVYLLSKYIKLSKNTENLIPSIILPIISTLIVSVVMFYVLGEPIKFLNNLLVFFLNEVSGISKILLGILLGAMMAFDMGGPVNKSAYVFGLISLSSGSSMTMAAVMAGGMIPPLSTSLATIIFKDKFTEEERKYGRAAGVLGLCFVTEGAIPIATKEPARIIPAIMFGSAVTSAISMFFKCTVAVPLGGIFIFPLPNVVGNLMLYIITILCGSIFTAIMIALVKKN